MFVLFIFFCWEYRSLSINNFHDDGDTSRARIFFFCFVHSCFSFVTFSRGADKRYPIYQRVWIKKKKKMKYRYIILLRRIHAGKINISRNILYILRVNKYSKTCCIKLQINIFIYFHM